MNIEIHNSLKSMRAGIGFDLMWGTYIPHIVISLVVFEIWVWFD